MTVLFLILTVVGLAHCQITDEPSNSLMLDETEWDCTNDHAPHATDKRKFLQSPNGFAEGSAVREATCPTRLQEFSQVNGRCRCLYTQSLRDILGKKCQVLVPSGAPADVYQLLVPNMDRETVDELFVPQTCFNVLPNYIADAYRAANVVPLFFNETGCRCDWIEGVDRSIERTATPPVGARCDRLVDQNFTSPRVGSDELGNWIDTFPSQYQNNLTVRNGGAVFGDGLISMVTWRLMAFDFDNINLVASFQTNDNNADNQLIFSSECLDSTAGSGGLVDVRYTPRSRQFSVRFFGGNTATCVVASPPGIQTVQLKYSNGSVSLLVNNVGCDLGSLNPVAPAGERLQFNSKCPFQVGGNVLTNIGQADFGRAAQRDDATGLIGEFYRFMALSNCDNPPAFIQDRIQGGNRFI